MQNNLCFWRNITCALPILSSAAFAAEEPRFGLYGGIDFQRVRINAEYDDYQVNALQLLGGKMLTDHWSAEGYFVFGLGDDTRTSTRGCIEETYELDSVLGLQIRGQLPLSDNFNTWLSLGVSQTSVSSNYVNACPINVNFRGVVADESETDLSYGIGGELRISPDSSVIVGFTQYYDDGVESDKLTVRAINVGYRIHF